MLNNGCVLHPEQYNLLFKTSFISLLSCIYSFYNGYYEFSVSSGWIFLTSINYWRKPNYSWRRDLDMISVKFALVHHVIRGYNSEYYKYYCIFTFISIFCYKLSCYFHKKKNVLAFYIFSCIATCLCKHCKYYFIHRTNSSVKKTNLFHNELSSM